MKQVWISATGELALRETPTPSLRGEGALVQTKFSAISVGTEGTVLKARRAKADPSAGEWAPGYSNAGVILETSTALQGFRPGDPVACAGGGHASHAEQCYVPKHLLARAPGNVDLREAAFSTLGAIAMQGLRRGRIEVGETVAVIGLGMIGQLAVQIARAAGTRVVAVDLNEGRLKLASQLGADTVINAQSANAAEIIHEFTQKRGVDLAVITASTPNSGAPMVQALQMVRHRGRVVVVGNLKCEFPRDIWYYKDAELLIATSYGPGRYDPQYEEGGHDYPIGYVRWTEGRNVQEFVQMLSAGQVKVAPLITHEFPFARAAEAFELVLNKPGECLGVVLRYGT
jgi:polar amino acid transport system substrate-binding protein